MPAASTSNQLPLFLSDRSRVEPHVDAALRTAQLSAGSAPISSGHLLRAVVAIARARPDTSPAFSRLQHLLQGLADDTSWRDFPETFNPERLAPSLCRSFQRTIEVVADWSEWSSGRLWGRDLISTALLDLEDPSLPELCARASVSATSLRDEWYEFLVRAASPTLPEAAYESLWRAAVAPIPAAFTPAIKTVDLLTAGETRISICHVKGKPWAIGVDAFSLPGGDGAAFGGTLATHLSTFTGGQRFQELVRSLHWESPRTKIDTGMVALAIVDPVLQKAGLPPLCVAADSRADGKRTAEQAGLAAVAACALAAKRGAKTLSLPLLGAGAGGLDAEQVLRQMIDALVEAEYEPRLDHVLITTLSDSEVRVAEQAATEFLLRRLDPASVETQVLAGSQTKPERGVDANVVLAVLLKLSEPARTMLATRLDINAAALELVSERLPLRDTGAHQPAIDAPGTGNATLELLVRVGQLRGLHPSLARVPDYFPLLAACVAIPAAGERALAAELLSVLEVSAAEVHDALLDELGAKAIADSVRAQVRAWLGARPTRSSGLGQRVRITNDQATGGDKLGIGNDVNALADVIAACDRSPPLAIGLFGPWGSGKTFFIDQLKKRLGHIEQAARLASQARAKTAYCKHIVHVDFNAWQYADGNLWANLVHRILEQLSAKLAPDAGPSQEEVRKALYEKLDMAQEQLAERKRVEDSLIKRKEDAQAQLEELEDERARTRADLAPLSLSAARRLAFEMPEVKALVEAAKKEWGASEASDAFEMLAEARAELSGLAGRLMMAWRAWGAAGPRMRRVALVLVAASTLAPFMAAYIKDRSAVLSALGVLLTTCVTWVQQITPHVRRADAAFSKVQAAQAAVRSEVERQRDEQDERHRQAIARVIELDSRIASVRTEQRQLDTQIVQIQSEIAQLTAGAQLRQFIQERSASEDYRKHLGIVATIRNDFARLQAILTEVHKSQGSGTDDPVDRVVLYVDDLDRCPADRVVEVLQAVHLLLDFPLFVAIVAVDPRWLLQSLESHYGAEFGADGSARRSRAIWAASPQDFLEKIFQIPFVLRPMSRDGFSALIRGLVPVAKSAGNGPRTAGSDAEDAVKLAGTDTSIPSPTAANTTPPSRPATDDILSLVPPRPSRTAKVEQPTGIRSNFPPYERTALPAQVDDGTGATAAERVPLDANPETLQIHEHECAAMEHLMAIVTTPRSTKRLVNLYYLIRASIPEHELEEFVGTPASPGACMVHLFLLGVLIGWPEIAETLLQELQQPRDASIADVLQHIDGPNDSAPRSNGDSYTSSSGRALHALASAMQLPSRVARYAEPARRIARFSFRTALMRAPVAPSIAVRTAASA